MCIRDRQVQVSASPSGSVAASATAWNIIGDPTEGAMIVAAAKAGYLQDHFARELPRVQETCLLYTSRCV